MMPHRRIAAFCLVICCACLVACSSDPEQVKRRHVERADEFARQGKLPEAIIEYRSAIAVDARFGEARLKLADAYARANDVQSAIREYIRAADLLPENVDAQVKAGRLLLLAGQFQEARARADTALLHDPQHVDAQLLRANALAGLKDVESAIAEVEHTLKSNPSNSAATITLGALRLAAGDTSQAEAAYAKAVASAPTSLQARLALANFYWSTGRHLEAEGALEAALRLEPRSLVANRGLAAFYLTTGRLEDAERPLKVSAELLGPAGRMTLADYYIRTQRREPARQIYQQLLQEREVASAAALRLASLGLIEGHRAEAHRLVDEVLEKEPKHPEALVSKARLLLQDNKLDEALTSIRIAVAIDAASPLTQHVLGTILAAQRQPEEATAAFKETLRLDPRFAPAHLELARLALAAGRPSDAVQFARSALDLVPGSADAHLTLARAHLANKEPQAAESSLRALGTALPDLPAVQIELGHLYRLKGDRRSARAAFGRALVQDPVAAGAVEALATMDVEDKDTGAARARVEAAVAAAPRNAVLQFIAARTLAVTGDFAGAEHALKQAIAIDPDYLQAYDSLGHLYAVQQRLPEATAEFEKLAALQPRSVGAQTAVALLLHLQDRPDLAETRYKQVLELNPHAAVASNNLAWMYAQRGENLDVALRLAQTAKTALPARHEVEDTLGFVYYKKGLSTLAAQAFRESLRRDPHNPLYHYHLALAHAQGGNKRSAREALRQSLTLNADFEGAADARGLLASLGG